MIHHYRYSRTCKCTSPDRPRGLGKPFEISSHILYAFLAEMLRFLYAVELLLCCSCGCVECVGLVLANAFHLISIASLILIYLSVSTFPETLFRKQLSDLTQARRIVYKLVWH